MPTLLVIYWRRRRALSLLVGLACVSAALGAFLGAIHVASVPAVSPESSGMHAFSVAIDAGHGGRDPGAIGATGLLEKEVTLGISLVLQEELAKRGMRVALIRGEDIDYGDAQGALGNTRKKRDLMTRLSIVQNERVDVLVSVHANSFPDPVWSGAQTFFYGQRERDAALASAVQDCLVRDLGPNNRRAKAADIFILRGSPVPAVTVEVGFLSNPREELLLRSAAYRLKVAKSIADGVVRYQRGKRAEPTPIEGSLHGRQAIGGLGPPRLAHRGDEVVLYFAGPTNLDDSLLPELRTIGQQEGAGASERASLVIQELLKGPGEDSVLERTLPPHLALRGVSVRDSVAYVDFELPEASRTTLGGRAEAMALYSVVNSLTELAAISAVKVSLNGRYDLTLAGHVMLDECFGRDESMIAEGR